MELQPQQHFFYDNKLYQAHSPKRSSTWQSPHRTIDNPNLNDVVIATGKVAVMGGYLYFDSNGYLDRDDGPAVDRLNYKAWYKHGKIHRIGSPAEHDKGEEEEGVEGFIAWYVDGKHHRTDGPAVTYTGGTEEWYVNGKLHRIDGPAVISIDGLQEWYVNGKLHRIDGPAVTYPDGSQQWFANDEFHRTDGPANVNRDGRQEWYVDGKLHRTDGPAIIRPDGTQEWWVNDEQVDKLSIMLLQYQTQP